MINTKNMQNYVCQTFVTLMFIPEDSIAEMFLA